MMIGSNAKLFIINICDRVEYDFASYFTRMSSGRLYQMVAYVGWSLISDGRLCRVAAYIRWSLLSNGRLYQMVAYIEWSLISDGRLYRVVAYIRWSLMSGLFHIVVVDSLSHGLFRKYRHVFIFFSDIVYGHCTICSIAGFKCR